MLNKEQRVFDFIEKIQALEGDYDALCQAFCDELSFYGLEFVTCAEVPGPGKRLEDSILFNSRPISYIEHYFERKHVLNDPIVTELRHTVTPFSWSDVKDRRRLSRCAADILEEGRHLGWHDGIVIPIVSWSGSVSIVSCCGLEPDLSSESRRALELICIYAQQAIRRSLINELKGSVKGHALTAREREVMQLVAAGKTDDEIGEILSIGRSTVTAHVEHAKHKLGANRRSYAIVQAIRSGEITL